MRGTSVSLDVVRVGVRVRVIVGFTTGLDNVEREAALQLHAGRSKDGPQRARGASLLSDDLTDIAGGDMEAKNGRFLLGNSLYPDRVGIVDQGPGNLRH
jgi:hypothetical protein